MNTSSYAYCSWLASLDTERCRELEESQRAMHLKFQECPFCPNCDIAPDRKRISYFKETGENSSNYELGIPKLIGDERKSKEQRIETDGPTVNKKKSVVWELNPKVDEDLRSEEILSNKELHEQRKVAFTIALKKCNDCLKSMKGIDEKVVEVKLDGFKAIQYDRIRVFVSENNNLDFEIGYFPVEMKATIPVLLPKSRQPIYLTVELNIDNPCASPVKNGPKVPHVGFKVTGPRCRFLTGHILMNKEGNEDLPHRRDDNIHWKDVGIHENIISTDKVFELPSNSDLILQRDDPNVMLHDYDLYVTASF